MTKRKVILMLRDGWGYSAKKEGNAQYFAYTPNTDYYTENYPFTLLKCTGEEVGLPEDTQGGSEVGHLTIGAGRTVLQYCLQINRAIADKSFFSNTALLDTIEHVKKNNSQLHIIGLFSDKAVHSTTEHLYALLEMAKDMLPLQLLDKIFVHCILDGRDVPEKSCQQYIEEFENRAEVGRIATLVGRYFSMDRDNNWDRTKRGYDLLTKGIGFKAVNAMKAIDAAYASGVQSDYYIEPITITDTNNPEGKPLTVIRDNDAVIFYNFRTDRTRQLTKAFVDPFFDSFEVIKLKNLKFTTMTHYDKTFLNPVAFDHVPVQNNLSSVLEKHDIKQLRIAETEKYPHVTFFFNSQNERPSKAEDRILVQSPKIPNYADKPEMSAYEVTEKLLTEIKSEKYRFIAVNFANPDLVGHSANFKATIKACEVVDECLGKIVSLGLEKEYVILITGDHGNSEEMLYPDGKPKPSHSLEPVQFHLISNDNSLKKIILKKDKGLSNIAPTILKIMNIEKPDEM